MTEPQRRRHLSLYRILLRLYPRALRDAHGEEMAQVVGDLLRERGRRAWGRAALDLAVSVPRTHLEVLVSASTTRAVLGVTLAVAGGLGVLGVLVVGPAALPLPVLVVGLTFAQRSRLARAVDGARGGGRQLGAPIALAASTLVLVGSVASWVFAVRRGYGFPDGVLLAYNVLGLGSVVGIVVSSILLVTRRSSRRATG